MKFWLILKLVSECRPTRAVLLEIEHKKLYMEMRLFPDLEE